MQAPDFGLIYTNALSDINTSGQNSRARWGQDLDFGKTITFEFGARHAFSDDMVLDVAVYNNDIVADPSFAYEHPIDPATGFPSIIYEVENTDFGNTRGVDVRLDRRIGNYFNGTLSYSFQDSKNTGTDPFSYLGFFEPLSGFAGEPPTAALPTGTSRPHSLTALFNLQLPADWERGNVLGAIFNRVGAYVTARVASGLAYTPCNPNDVTSIGVVAGNGNTGSCGNLGAVAGYNAARLPTLKQLDLRLTKDFHIGKYLFTGYLDARNVLNLTNVLACTRRRGPRRAAPPRRRTSPPIPAPSPRTAASPANCRTTATSTCRARLPVAARSPAVATPTPRSATTTFAPNSGSVTATGSIPLAEQRIASNSNRAFTNSIYNFVTGARTIRFGLEVNF